MLYVFNVKIKGTTTEWTSKPREAADAVNGHKSKDVEVWKIYASGFAKRVHVSEILS